MGMDEHVQDKLCDLCLQFVGDVTKFDFQAQETYSDRWIKDHPRYWTDWGHGFFHHDSHADLLGSKDQGCALCDVIEASFSASSQSPKCVGRLILFPFARFARGEPRSFVASFDGSPGSLAQWGRQDQAFFFGRRRPWDSGVSTTSPEYQGRWKRQHERDFPRAVARSSASRDVLETARFWLRDCTTTHAKCSRNPAILPTRVIDVGTKPGDAPVLFVTEGRVDNYAALSHCWGGNIPCKLINSVLGEYQKRLPVEQLPQNFRDTIHLTRELGLRYVWIDALCIIQDSADDWKLEAAKMAEIYSKAAVTISTLNSDRSTSGFLKPRQTKAAVVSSEFTVQELLPSLLDTLEDSCLNTRGWCMQERLLSMALLHIGESQVFWECRAGYGSEVGDFNTSNDRVGVSFNYATKEFIELRQKFNPATFQGWNTWYNLVTEYTARNLTFTADKFPALAGAARVFQQGSSTAEYVAGLWKQDLANGLVWGALSKRAPAQKAAGFNFCYDLASPATKRAPSWSWASVDGPVQFYGGRKEDPGIYEVLDVTMNGGLDNLEDPPAEGTLKLRARVALMHYKKPEYGDHVGSLTFEIGGPRVFSFCVMDFDRKTDRECWVLLTGGDKPNCLMLRKIQDNRFSRIGFGVTYMSIDSEYLKRFTVQDIILI